MIQLAARTNVSLVDLLIGALEYHDPYFRGNSSLVRLLSAAIGKQLQLPDAELERLAMAALLRDLGRLMQRGRLVPGVKRELDSDEQKRVEGHVEMGLSLLEGIELPDGVLEAVRHHHERWDGEGYPSGLQGAAIPRHARILAVADAFAAMIAPRPYRLPRKLPGVVRELQLGAGRQFDPEVVLALTAVLGKWGQDTVEFGFHHHILVIHPEDTRATALAARLCSSGFLADVAWTADSARTRLRRAPVEAVVISADLPKEEAVRFIKDLRGEPYFAEVLIIAVDAAEAEVRAELIGAGADACLPDRTSHGELRAVLSTLLGRAVSRRVEVRTPLPMASYSLQGDLSDFPMEWLLQMLHYDGRTALVSVDGEGGDGVVFLNQGAPIHAEAQSMEGEDALCEMLRWREGRFVVQPDTVIPERTIERDLMKLLLDEAVEQDQAADVFGAVSPY